ncbi:MAG TPA: dihydrolipoamide acetyltransferase family protein [Candidatus Nanoarchaeia archaeon]|nr:dihydrolipoamide acetyltransferase family protein [Candidatus Nanoarchaeia archaeon]
MTEFRFPDVAEGIKEGKLISWKVKEGDLVEEDQALCEMETDKSVLEIPSPQKGVIQKLHYFPGQMVPVGEVLVTFAGNETASRPSEEKPTATHLSSPTSVVSSIPSSLSKSSPRILPKDRKLARQLGIDLTQVQGTGKNGRITEQDLRQAVGQTPSARPIVVEHPPSRPALAVPSNRKLSPSQRKRRRELGTTELIPPPSLTLAPASSLIRPMSTQDTQRIKIGGVRAAIKKHMEEAWKIPHASVTVPILADRLIQHLQRAKVARPEVKLTLLSYLVKAAANALENFPTFNASFDDTTQEIILKKAIHIGIAVDTEYGLMVPNIKNANQKTILQLASEVQELAEKARTKKLNPIEITGGTFTVNNLGSLGISAASSIIHLPELAILAIGKMYEQTEKEGLRTYLPLTLTFDHRILDGGDAARFLHFIRQILEDPQMPVDVKTW